LSWNMFNVLQKFAKKNAQNILENMLNI